MKRFLMSSIQKCIIFVHIFEGCNIIIILYNHYFTSHFIIQFIHILISACTLYGCMYNSNINEDFGIRIPIIIPNYRYLLYMRCK